MKSWTGLLEQARPLLGAPSFLLFTDLLTGWVCVPGRRTITAMIAVADPAGRRAHDAYHRFSRDGPWKMSGLWKVLAIHVVARHAPTGVIELLCDDTLAKTLCEACPALTECLAGALERQEPWGVWGGELFVQGAIVASKRPRGRPRKNPAAA